MTTPEATPTDADRFATAKEVLARFACPVVVIGAAAEGRRSCATGTAMYVSFAPAILAVAVHPGSTTSKLIEKSRELSLSVLAQDQQDLAMAAGRSSPGLDKFAALGIPVLEAPSGMSAPAVAGSIVVAWCRVLERHGVGDHVLHVVEVVSYRNDPAKTDPLMRFDRRYAELGQRTSEESPEGYPT